MYLRKYLFASSLLAELCIPWVAPDEQKETYRKLYDIGRTSVEADTGRTSVGLLDCTGRTNVGGQLAQKLSNGHFSETSVKVVISLISSYQSLYTECTKVPTMNYINNMS